MLDADKAYPEIDLVLGDKTYKFVLSVKAFILAERATGKNFFKGELLTDLSLGSLVALVWAGLQKHHPNLKLEDIEDKISFADIASFRAQAATAIQRAAPPDKAEKKREASQNSTSSNGGESPSQTTA